MDNKKIVADEPAPVQGPRRKAPEFYIGDGRLKGRPINHPDVERKANGQVVGKRDKAARRMLRKALKKSRSTTEHALEQPRAMQAQAAEVMREEGRRGGRAGRRLFERMLDIHQPRPNELTRAQRRSMQKALRKAGKKDAITELVDAFAAAHAAKKGEP